MILKILGIFTIVVIIGIASLFAIAVMSSQSEPKPLPEIPLPSERSGNQVIICPNAGETDPSNCYNSYRDNP